MKMATDDHQPPMVRGQVETKIRARQANSPIIVIHGNRVRNLPDLYKRFLMERHAKRLEIMGTPIRIQFQNSENPFEAKTNKPTISGTQT